MAQPNVVREPSMDEILASIRRIIESNDPVPQSGTATSRADPDGFMGSAANDDSMEVTLTVDDTFGDEDEYLDEHASTAMTSSNPFRAVEPVMMAEQLQPVPKAMPSSGPVQDQPRTLSLADVAARVRAASERSAAERMGELERPRDSIAETSVESRREPDPAVAMTAPEPETPMPRPLESSAVQSASLLSSAVGEQVARSFQDLAFAVDDAERRSLDQMAEDMLRPMLQEWLDNNLPMMVERLVREEIERVTRGARR